MVAGGQGSGATLALNTTELYDPATRTWQNSGPMATSRRRHTATLLPNGQVLVVGGADNSSNVISGAELYDPATKTWKVTGSLTIARFDHTATLLADGKVLVTGGNIGANVATNSAEIYDPATGQWTATGNLNTARRKQAAVLLTDGQVLVVGGIGAAALSSAERYNPTTGSWSTTGAMSAVRVYPTATLLPNGIVLVAGGHDNGGTAQSSSEIYQPGSGTWSNTAETMSRARFSHTATLLPNGTVLVAGGQETGPLTSVEIYNPPTQTWINTDTLNYPRQDHSATLLLNGQVLVAGGQDNNGAIDETEFYDRDLGFSEASRPMIMGVTSPLPLNSQLAISGSGFQGLSEATSGGGHNNSATNYPLIQLRRLDSEQIRWQPHDMDGIFSDTAVTSSAVSDFPQGPVLATVFVNGIPSVSKLIMIDEETNHKIFLPMIVK